VKLEEPEPADGWDNYDTYIANNLNPPDEIKTKQNSGGEVEISFEVDKNGNPVNIKVEKSLCSKCDQEAIRLIKQGPKWKRNAKKGRTTVTVPFNNSL
jgi:TonB family protein